LKISIYTDKWTVFRTKKADDLEDCLPYRKLNGERLTALMSNRHGVPMIGTLEKAVLQAGTSSKVNLLNISRTR
jgi:hypothetical protein